jgi:hypothetical protein
MSPIPPSGYKPLVWLPPKGTEKGQYLGIPPRNNFLTKH